MNNTRPTAENKGVGQNYTPMRDLRANPLPNTPMPKNLRKGLEASFQAKSGYYHDLIKNADDNK